MEHCIKKRIILRYNEQLETRSDADIAHDVFILWLQTYDKRYALYSHKDIFETIIHTCTGYLAHLLTMFSCDAMYLPVLYYCDLYLQRKKSIAVSELLPLVFVSSIVTVKFWNEEHIEDINLVVSKLSAIPLNVLLKMEVEMLKTIEYSLLIDDEKIREFKEAVKNKYTNSINKYHARKTANGEVAGRKRMRLMDDIDYYKYYHNNKHYITTSSYETKRVKMCES